MGATHIRVREDIHKDIKALAEKENKGIFEVTNELIIFALKHYHTKELLLDTDIEKIINNRIGKLEEQLERSTERLASLMARVGIDNSMGLMANIILLEKLLKLNRNDIQNELRKQGVMYFSNATKEDKEKKKGK